MRARRAQKRQRGAVLVESLVVSVLLVVFLACTVYAHALYAHKIGSSATARELAWRRALPGCEGGLTQLAVEALSGGAFDALQAADAFGVAETPDWISDMNRGVGETSPVRITAADVVGGYGTTLTSRNAVACNEYGDDTSGGLLSNAGELIRQLIPGI